MALNNVAATPARPQMFFYVPGECHPQDVAIIPAECADALPGSDLYRGAYSGKSFAEFKEEYPAIMVLTWEEVEHRANEAARQPVKEITEEIYVQMLNILPPMNWRVVGSDSSFMLMEMFSGNVTDIYARICEAPDTYRFFTLRDICTLKHEEIISRCHTFLSGE